VLALVHIEMQKLNNRLRKHKTALRLHASAEQFLVASYQNQYGARDIIRNLRTHVEPAMARVLNASSQASQYYIAEYADGKIVIHVSKITSGMPGHNTAKPDMNKTIHLTNSESHNFE
jgi:ATP-dependent Clp protease ATP-binding subunit ClpA